MKTDPDSGSVFFITIGSENAILGTDKRTKIELLRMIQHRYIALILTLLLAGVAPGDVIVLKDGRIFNGEIVQENAESVTMEVLVSNIKSTLTFKMHNIEMVTHSDGADQLTGKPKSPSNPDAAPQPNLPRSAPQPKQRQRNDGKEFNRYFEIPIHGEFGVDILPEGVAKSLTKAKSLGLTTIVFDIDSDGGYTWAASGITKLLRENKGRFKYYAYIHNASSEAIWVILSCDGVFMHEDSSIGNAASHTLVGGRTAAANAKASKAYTSKLISLAKRHGNGADIAMAMVDRDAELYITQNPLDGTHSQHRRRIDIPSDHDVVIDDDKHSVLTLNGDEAVRIGFALPAIDSIGASLERHVDRKQWRQTTNIGEKQMRFAAQRSSKLLDEYAAAHSTFKSSMATAADTDPSNGRYAYYSNGRIVSRYRQIWVRRAKDSIAALERADQSLVAIQNLEKTRAKQGIPRGMIKDLVDHVAERRAVAEKISRIRVKWDSL